MNETIKYVMELDSDQFKKDAKSAGDSLKGTGDKITGMGKDIAKYSVASTAFLGVVAKGFMEGEVAVKRFDTVFEDSADSVAGWYEDNKKYISLTEEEYKGLAAGVGDILKPMGFTSEAVAELTPELIQQAQALADWTGRSVEESLSAITSATLGQTKSLEGFGIKLDQTMIKERAKQIQQESSIELSEKEAKALATKELITESATDANKAYADSMADGGTSQKTFAIAMRDLRQALENMGNAIAPALVPMIEGFSKVAEMISNIPGPILAVIAGFLAFVAVLGPLLMFIGGLISAIGTIISILPVLGAGIAILTGPIGWVILAVIGLIAIFVMFKDQIFAVLTVVWEKMKQFGTWLIGALASLGSKFIEFATFILNLYIKIWTTILTTVFNFFSNILSAVGSGLSSMASAFTNGLGVVKDIFFSVFQSIYDFVMGIFNGILGGITSIFNKASSLAKGIGDKVSAVDPFDGQKPQASTNAINDNSITNNQATNNKTNYFVNGKREYSQFKQMKLERGL